MTLKILLAAILMPFHAVAAELLLETPQGRLLGETAQGTEDIAVFKGIPYAVPPVGILRWAPPEATVPSWTGTRTAQSFAPACLQQLIPGKADYIAADITQGEDCLYLNVWSPIINNKVASTSNRPVLFVIHAGGMIWGTASEPSLHGRELARKGIVVVTLNYRLGMFSFFSHPELSAESPHKASGNYALLDLIQGLKWVRANIAAYGGDPSNVTIAGMSGGGTAASLLVASPLAKGLFQRAILHFAPALRPQHLLNKAYLNQPSAERLGMRFMEKMGVQSLKELRKIPAQVLQKRELVKRGATMKTVIDSATGMFAVVDGWVLPKQAQEIYAKGEQNKVPVLLGFSADEFTTMRYLLGKMPDSADAYEDEVKKRYGDLASEYLKVYPSENYQDAIYDSVRDGVIGWSTQTIARTMERVSSNAYLYYMAHIPPGGEELLPDSARPIGASHKADYPYFFNYFNDVNYGKGTRDADRILADQMSDYYVAFINKGDPNMVGLPEWKPYTNSSRDYMAFRDGKLQSSKDLLPGTQEIYSKINTRRRQNGIFWTYQAGLNGYSESDFVDQTED